jgi:hypothetical protein
MSPLFGWERSALAAVIIAAAAAAAAHYHCWQLLHLRQVALGRKNN